MGLASVLVLVVIGGLLFETMGALRPDGPGYTPEGEAPEGEAPEDEAPEDEAPEDEAPGPAWLPTMECLDGAPPVLIWGKDRVPGAFADLQSIGDDEIAVCLDARRLIPKWTANRIRTGDGAARPKMQFKTFEGFPVTHSDYGSITCAAPRAGDPPCYDRGHLSPNADLAEGAVTFTMANVIPQYSNHNQGQWRELEASLRERFPGHVVVTVTLPRWGDRAEWPVRVGAAGSPKTLMAPAGLCRVILEGRGEVVHWECLEHVPQRRRYADIPSYQRGPPGVASPPTGE